MKIDRTEDWRPIHRWEGLYEVSSHGRIRSLDRIDARGRRWRGRIMRGMRDRAGWYTKVNLVFGTRREQQYVHRLVAAAFLGPCPPGIEVNHIDGDKTNNAVGNLEYVTHLGNARHAQATGLLRTGARHHATKLTPQQAQMVLQLKGRVGIRRLSKWFGVDPSTIKAIRDGRTWTHLKQIPADTAA
jgi:hypothetical protein